jgi:hypothetical protein
VAVEPGRNTPDAEPRTPTSTASTTASALRYLLGMPQGDNAWLGARGRMGEIVCDRERCTSANGATTDALAFAAEALEANPVLAAN